MQQLNKLKQTTKYFSIGKTALGKNIWCFVLGDNPTKKLIIQASIHAREYLTTLLLIEQIKHLANFHFNGVIYFVPLVNVDGVKVVKEGINSFKPQIKQRLCNIIGDNNYKLFKSNINGVDLNTNFDANWSNGKHNIKQPYFQNYIGPYPHSEPETQALVNLTKQIKPDMTISYHLKGEVVYYGFLGQTTAQQNLDKHLANIICKHTGYRAVLTKNSCGGYKDYCTTYYNIPAVTIEVGSDEFKHPFPDNQLQDIIDKNLQVPLVALKFLEKI